MDLLDAVIVGAGPAGIAAAITLHRAGRTVVVIDKATFPRDKICGDGLTAGALRELEALGLDPSTVPSWRPVDELVVRSPRGHEVTFPLPRGRGQFAAIATRLELDHALVRHARALGVVVRDGHGLLAARVDGAAIEIAAAGLEPLRARCAIGADGMWSPLRKCLDIAQPGYLGEWHAFRQYFTGVTGRAAQQMLVWFEPALLPGYAWSFPLASGRANVGFGIMRRPDTRTGVMKELWPSLLQLPYVRDALGPDARPESPHRAWPIPARIDSILLTAPRTLFAGDAAAATDLMTGEGIGQALVTGRLAAQAIVAGGDDATIRACYERAVRHALVTDHRMSAALQPALAHRRSADAAVRLAGISEWTRRNFARWLMEDYPRALLITPRRWHRGALHQRGAYLG